MNQFPRKDINQGDASELDEGCFPAPSNARASVVNRTRRVIHDQAVRMQQDRSRHRSLWLPLAICSTLLLVLCYAIWGMMAGYDLTPTSIPDASDQMLFFLMLWSIPVAAVALGLIWFRRSRAAHEGAGESTL